MAYRGGELSAYALNLNWCVHYRFGASFLGSDFTHQALSLAPLQTLGLFRLFRRLFIGHFNREPKDTAFTAERGLAADRFFNIVYACLAMPILFLPTVGMDESAKSGW
jgi:hypothetical protein